MMLTYLRISLVLGKSQTEVSCCLPQNVPWQLHMQMLYL